MIGPRRIEEPPSAEETQRKMQDELRRERLSVRGELGSLPVDRDRARREITDEERVLRNSRPRNRRWRALEKLDREVDRLTHEHAAAIAELQAAEQALAAAPDHDARTLADWLAAGQRGERPVATVYERTRERDAAQLNIDAIAVELDRALERRVKHVERHRKNMLADARRDVTDAQQRLAAKLEELPPLREELLAARETLLWIVAFPERIEAWGYPMAVALGLQKPVETTLGTKARIEYTALLAALAEDANAIANAFSREQKATLGTTDPRTPTQEAMWDTDPDNVAWKRQELERVRKLAEWHRDPDEVASEARDLRP